jgi:glycosyltransferase involved in cell wall biosynthesis
MIAAFGSGVRGTYRHASRRHPLDVPLSSDPTPSDDRRWPRILLVAYHFPPAGGGGVQRPAKMVKSWARSGAPVAVVTGPGGVSGIADSSLVADLPDDLPRVGPTDPSPQPRIQRLRKRLPAGTVGWIADRTLVGLSRIARTASVPDIHWGWYLPAIRHGMKLAREFRPDVVVATGPPFTTFLVAANLARRLRLPLVLDYRDPWTATYLPSTPPWPARILNPRLERKVLGQAAAVVTAHRAVFRFLRERFAEPVERCRRMFVPNGFDPDDFGADPVVDEGKFTLIYTGTFFAFRDPRHLLAALGELLESSRIDPARFRFRIAGVAGHGIRLRGVSPALDRVVRVEGYLLGANANLVLEGGAEGGNLHTPGKFYEALYAGRPLLLLCPEGTTTRLARRAGGCFICPSDDKEAIQGQLLRLYGAWRDGRELDGPERDRVRFYDRGFQARRMLRFLRSVHEDRARDLR